MALATEDFIMLMPYLAWRHAYAHSGRCRQGSERSEARERLTLPMFSWGTGPMFGARRPLRHLAWKLHLDESQVRDILEVLDALKTAYQQARLDRDRSTSEIASVFGGEQFDAERASAALAARTRASEALHREQLASMRRMFEILNPDQRRDFAYLLRSGEFVL